MAAIAVAAPGAAGGGPYGGAGTTTSGSTALASLQSSPQLAGVMAVGARLKDYAANAFAEVRGIWAFNDASRRRLWRPTPRFRTLSNRPAPPKPKPIQSPITAQALGRGL